MHNKDKKGLKRIVALLILLSVAFCSLGNIMVTDSAIALSEDTTIIETDKTSILKQEDVPELIGYESAKVKGHVMRNRASEPDLHTVSFKNSDRSETVYIFADPVKYVDSNGEIRDKSTELTLSGTDLMMADNDINVCFPQKLNSGISITKDEYCISMLPYYVSSASRTSFQNAKNTYGNKVNYKNAFGEGVNLEYTAVYSGVKEVIVLESLPTSTAFSFIVNTGGLALEKNANGSCFFYDTSTDCSVAEMTPVICYDSVGNFAGGDINVVEMISNSKYIVTIVPDYVFLTSESTVYPVYVDPTITLNTTTAIEDAVIYSGMPNTNFGAYYFNTVGYLDDTYKLGHLLVKFPTMVDDAVFEYTTANQIVSANFSIYTGGSGVASTIKAYSMSASWDESTITWNSFSATPIIPVHISSTAVPTTAIGKTTFDILPLVRGWTDGTYDPSRGLMLCNANSTSTTYARTFLSTEYALNNNLTGMPCLEIVHSNLLEPQFTEQWCWAACARMASFIKMDSDISQASAAVKIKKHIETEFPTAEQIAAATKPADVSETEMALEYILKGQYDAYSVDYKIYSELVLQNMLDYSGCIIILRGLYSQSNNRWTGHYICIRSYYWDENLSDYVYVIYDPAPMNEGDIYIFTYEEICCSTHNESYRWIWECIVTYKEANYLQTIDWIGY